MDDTFHIHFLLILVADIKIKFHFNEECIFAISKNCYHFNILNNSKFLTAPFRSSSTALHRMILSLLLFL